ncbi:MAG TPA: AMP-binding protein, partial [Acidimicrobiales bacterium]|nr:AMP-binding protein [Acidimicrobiales bacterium]
MSTATPAITVAELLVARAGDDHLGLRFEDQQWSWREVIDESAARGSLLRQLRREGPFHAGILLGNVPGFLLWLGGAALAGAVVVGVNTTRRGEALADDIRRTDCQLLITDTEGAALVAGLDLGFDDDRLVLIDDPATDQAIEAHRGVTARSLVDAATPDPGDLYLLLFTSGTTGAPKAVRCTQGRLAAIGQRAAAGYGFDQDDVAYCSMPLFHGNSLMALWAPVLAVGATVALARRFSASGFVDDVRRHGVTTFTYVGKALAYVLATPPRPDDAELTLRRGFGTEASVADHAAFEQRFGCRLSEGYGSSEGGATITRVPGTPTGSLGKPHDDVAVVDPSTETECPRATFDEGGRLTNGDVAVGEIVNRSGLGGFEGYYRNLEATEDRTRHGWYWTGDLAYRDAEGFFYFAGRRGDWLRVDSENLTAGPIERILLRFADIAAVAVYAVPDARTGDQVMAAFEMLPGVAFDPGRFAEFLDAQPDLGTKWAPSFIVATASFPQTASGKVTKEVLRAEGWWATHDPVFWRPPPVAAGGAGRRRYV